LLGLYYQVNANIYAIVKDGVLARVRFPTKLTCAVQRQTK